MTFSLLVSFVPQPPSLSPPVCRSLNATLSRVLTLVCPPRHSYSINMRFTSFLFTFVALPTFFLSALARPKAFYTPTVTRRTDAISSRQYHAPRQLLNVCAVVDLSVLENLLDLDLCLCLSALPVQIQANAGLSLLSGLLGKDNLVDDLTSLIDSSPSKQTCHYPDHSTPFCSKSNPCDFNCKPPFVKSGNQCVCPAGTVPCNGSCAKTCGSSLPQSGY